MSMTEKKKDLLVMKFLHYFITKKNYNPVVVHGIQNEIWLENLESDIRIVRIVLGYIHNKEQLNFDTFKVNKLVKQIKRKTFSFKMNVMSIYLDLNDDVSFDDVKNNYFIKINKESDLKKNEYIKQFFPDMVDNLKFTEEGSKLYMKINDDILKMNANKTEQINELFSEKKPYITYILMFIMSIAFILMYLLGNGSMDVKTLYNFGGLVKDLNPLRLITSIFLHIGLFHYLMNMWVLKILGKQTENFYGHIKLLIIFLYSGIIGNMLSVLLMESNVVSAGASGSLFGLMGAILYFAINQRTYIGQALKRDILPVIFINLFLSFVVPSINLYAHIGGFVSGMLISNAVGIKYKTSKVEKVNGIICSILLFLLLFYFTYLKELI